MHVKKKRRKLKQLKVDLTSKIQLDIQSILPNLKQTFTMLDKHPRTHTGQHRFLSSATQQLPERP